MVSTPITGKYQEQSAILPISLNMAVLRIVIIVRIPESGNCKKSPILRTSGNQALKEQLLSIGETGAQGPAPALITIPVYHARTRLSRLPLKNSGLSGACQNRPPKNSCSITWFLACFGAQV